MPSIHISERAFNVIAGHEGSEKKAKNRIKMLANDYAKELVDDECQIP